MQDMKLKNYNNNPARKKFNQPPTFREKDIYIPPRKIGGHKKKKVISSRGSPLIQKTKMISTAKILS